MKKNEIYKGKVIGYGSSGEGVIKNEEYTIFVPFTALNEQIEYKVLKVVDGDTFYVDFNGNNKIDKNEKVRVNGIDTFETKINDGLAWQKKIYKLSTRQALGMGYLAKKYAQKQLLNKTVHIDFSAEQKYDAYNRGLVSVYYNCGKNPSLRSNGIATLNFVHPSEYCRSYET